jgi:general secretion pathway protein F
MCVVATGILAYIFTSVVPKITRMFVKQKLSLPWYTKFIMNITEILTTPEYILTLIGVVVLAGFLLLRYKNSPKGREKLDRLRLKIYVFGELNQKVAVARFSRTLSTLLSSGVQLLPALEIVRNVMDNVILSKIIEETMVSVKEGESLAEPLRRSGRFPSMFIHMIMVGEKTGLLEQMLEKVADTYDLEVNTFVEGMTSLLTPVMLVVMGGVIGFIVISVMSPIFQLMQR